MSSTYKIGEAARLLNLKTYVLRFWETEFPQIVPLRTEKGQRLYTKEHVALLRRIRHLLHERGLTIEGARRVLVEETARQSPSLFGNNGLVKRAEAGHLSLLGPYEGAGSAPAGEGLEEHNLYPAFEQDSSSHFPAGFEPENADISQRMPLCSLGEQAEATRMRVLLREVESELEDLAEELRRSLNPS